MNWTGIFQSGFHFYSQYAVEETSHVPYICFHILLRRGGINCAISEFYNYEEKIGLHTPFSVRFVQD